ncbi:hypothetical protein EVAR_12185_1 [Eumeta japonica]|uniref:Uncharacterized protein n=1 Tax=Eumeta variegata TaxID=151549 RepID=A0A4C1UID5_EUMVA|nr:hypothetical protein EVAR_12185_1 [Eumeta japonica]
MQSPALCRLITEYRFGKLFIEITVSIADHRLLTTVQSKSMDRPRIERLKIMYCGGGHKILDEFKWGMAKKGRETPG